MKTSYQRQSVHSSACALLSMVFGNAVGLVETRKGKLYGRGDVRGKLQRTLHAGDILLEKTLYHDGKLVNDKPLDRMVKLMKVQAEQ